MKIVIDTREQKKLEFKHPFVKGIMNYCLDEGDYGAIFSDTYSCPIVFERKSIPDLYGSLSKQYDRFKREIERAREKNIQLIIIVEGNLTKVLHGAKYSMRTPESLVYQIFTLRVRYNIETVFCKDAVEMAEYISQFFIAHYKEYEEKLIKERL